MKPSELQAFDSWAPRFKINKKQSETPGPGSYEQLDYKNMHQ